MRFNQRWCGKCATVAFIVLALFSVQAVAQSLTPSNGPSWEQWATIIGTIALAVISAYVTGQTKRVDGLEKALNGLDARHQATRELLFKEYHSGNDIREILQSEFAPLRKDNDAAHAKLNAVHKRMDKLLDILASHGVRIERGDNS